MELFLYAMNRTLNRVERLVYQVELTISGDTYTSKEFINFLLIYLFIFLECWICKTVTAKQLPAIRLLLTPVSEARLKLTLFELIANKMYWSLTFDYSFLMFDKKSRAFNH